MTRIVDLFCGAGGFTLGAQTAGAEVVLGVDKWEPAIATATAAGHHAVCADIGRLNDATSWVRSGGDKARALWARTVRRHGRYAQYGYLGPAWDDLVEGPVDGVIGGPPCQPFSSAGEGKGEADERDGYPAAIAAIRALKPRWCALENVRGFLFERHRAYRESVLAELREVFPWVGVWLLRAADFGVPQHRRRVFIVGAPCFIPAPTPTHRDPALPLDLFDRRAPWVDRVPGIPVEMPLPSPTVTATEFKGATCNNWQKLNRASDALWGATGKNRLTISQCATLQDFPANYPWTGTSEARYRQVGNAVPRRLGAAVVGAIMEGLA